MTAASGVTLKTGERVTLRDFVLPRDVVFATVSGIVVDAAGAPAANALVYLKEADYILSEPAITDGSGRFTLAAVAGGSYQLFAERPRDDAASVRVDSSEPIAFTAAVGCASRQAGSARPLLMSSGVVRFNLRHQPGV